MSEDKVNSTAGAMKQALEEEAILRRFLLGELDAEQQAEVEERLFTDADFFNLYRAAEDELTDEYLYGDLEPGERERFETAFLTTPERRESLRAAAALQKYILNHAADSPVAETAVGESWPRRWITSAGSLLRARRPALQFSLAAVALLLLTAGTLVFIRSSLWRSAPAPIARREEPSPTPPQLAQTPTDTESPQSQNNNDSGPLVTPSPSQGDKSKPAEEGPKPPPHVRRASSLVYAILLPPSGQVRGGGDAYKVTLPARSTFVDLQLPLIEEGGRRSYQATLETDEGKRIKTWTGLTAVESKHGQSVVVRVTQKLLGQQTYRINLKGASPDGTLQIVNTFRFQVAK